MAANTKLVNTIRRIGRKIRSGLIDFWNRPALITGILLVLAVFLGGVLIKQTLKPYTNCGYLIDKQLGLEVSICNISLFFMPSLSSRMDQPLELARSVIAWIVIIFFAFISLYLTIIIEHFRSIIRLLRLNKEEWKKFIASARIFLLLFVAFCLVFYFTVIQ